MLNVWRNAIYVMVNLLNYKVTDHCHRTGNYRGAAHVRCTINYCNNIHLPVFFFIN